MIRLEDKNIILYEVKIRLIKSISAQKELWLITSRRLRRSLRLERAWWGTSINGGMPELYARDVYFRRRVTNSSQVFGAL